MSIGASTLNTANINAIIGNWAVQLQDMFLQAPGLQATINGIGLAGLQAAPYSMTAADAQALINFCNDLVTYSKVYNGLMYIAAGATANSGVPTNNDATHFGYNFGISIGKAAGVGF